jgi:hypothetical protein
MSDASDIKCLSCCEQIERVRYFPRQLITADDMRVEQEYFREKHRRHNRFLHGWGVVCGCAVEPVAGAKTWTVRVCPGYAVAPQGDEILIDDCRDVDLQLGATPEPCTVRWPCPPTGDMPAAGSDGLVNAYIAVRYAECFARPTRVHPAGCGCDESACEYSRIRDSYEIKVLWKVPDSHVNAAKDDLAWLAALKQGSLATQRHPGLFPVPPCPECELDPWVVLAMVTFPATAQAGSSNSQIQVNYTPRRTLLATQRLQTVLAAL